MACVEHKEQREIKSTGLSTFCSTCLIIDHMCAVPASSCVIFVCPLFFILSINAEMITVMW